MTWVRVRVNPNPKPELNLPSSWAGFYAQPFLFPKRLTRSTVVHCKNIALSSNIPKTKKNKQTKAESTYSSSRPWIMRRFLKNVRLVNSGLCRSTTNAPVISCTDSNTENCSKRASGVLDDSLSNVHTISHEYYVKRKTVQKYATNTNCIESLTAVYLLQFSTAILSQFLLMNSRDCPNFVKISRKGFFLLINNTEKN